MGGRSDAGLPAGMVDVQAVVEVGLEVAEDSRDLVRSGSFSHGSLPGSLPVVRIWELVRSRIIGLILEVPQVGVLGKSARRPLRSARHGNLLFVWRPVSARRAERRIAYVSGRQRSRITM